MSEFSVIIPTHNRAALLPATLQRVLDQDRPAKDVVVVDDRSTDDTEAVVRSFADRVVYLKNPGVGLQAARNAGAERSTGDWLAFCDDDDLWKPDHLKRVAALVEEVGEEEVGELDFVFANFQHVVDGVWQEETKFASAPEWFWPSTNHQEVENGIVFTGHFSDPNSLAANTILFHPIFASAMTVSRSFFLRIGGFDVALNGRRSEDGQFALRCLCQGTCGAIREPTVGIRKHSGNISGNTLRCLLDQIITLKEFERHPEMGPGLAPAIGRGVRKRRIEAARLAFGACDKATFREATSGLDTKDLPGDLKIKAAVAKLPAPIFVPVNKALQALSTGIRGMGLRG